MCTHVLLLSVRGGQGRGYEGCLGMSGLYIAVLEERAHCSNLALRSYVCSNHPFLSSSTWVLHLQIRAAVNPRRDTAPSL